MASIGKLVTHLVVDSSQFDSKMSKSGKLIKSWKTIAVGGIAAAGAAMTAISVKAIGLASEIENISTQFRVMLKSSSAAATMLKKISKFAASTPFQKMELAQAAQSMLGVGVAAGDVIPKLRQIGDVAALSGNRIGDVTAILNKIESVGFAQGETLNQLMERRIPILNALTEVTGKSAAELRKMGSQGLLTSDLIGQAFQKMTDKGGIFENGMAELAKTTAGKWSTMKDNINAVFEEFGATLLPAVNSAMNSVTAKVQGFITWMKPKWAGIQAIATGAWQAIEAAAKSAIDVIKSSFKLIGDVPIKFDTFALSAVTALAATEGMFTSLTDSMKLSAVTLDMMLQKLKDFPKNQARALAGMGPAFNPKLLELELRAEQLTSKIGANLEKTMADRLSQFQALRRKTDAPEDLPGPKPPPPIDTKDINKAFSDAFATGIPGLAGSTGLGAAADFINRRFPDQFAGPPEDPSADPAAAAAKSSGMKAEMKFAGAMERGSVEAMKLLTSQIGGGKTPEKQLVEAKKQTGTLKQILDQAQANVTKFSIRGPIS